MYDDRICKRCPSGAHIEFQCPVHPEKRWSTKNIAGRSFFYKGSWGTYEEEIAMGPACECSLVVGGPRLVHVCPNAEAPVAEHGFALSATEAAALRDEVKRVGGVE